MDLKLRGKVVLVTGSSKGTDGTATASRHLPFFVIGALSQYDAPNSGLMLLARRHSLWLAMRGAAGKSSRK